MRGASGQARPRGLRGSVPGLLLLTLVAGLALGCARYQYVNVRSRPAGAEVFLDGRSVGRTPLRVVVDRTKDHLVFLKLEGYVPERQVLTLNKASDGIDFLTPADVDLPLGRDFSRSPTRPSDDAGLEGRPAPEEGLDDRRDVDVRLEKKEAEE